jgi:transcriptional regulator with XRE-family HTH domain
MAEKSEQIEENLVKKTCDILDISQKELAERIGVSNNTISSWKNDKQPIPKWGIKLFKFAQIEQDYKTLLRLINKKL